MAELAGNLEIVNNEYLKNVINCMFNTSKILINRMIFGNNTRTLSFTDE